MAANNSDANRIQLKPGAHRLRRERRSAIKRSIAAGGAVACFGFIAELDLPMADALSIVFHGAGSTTQVNILEGNVFDPQLRIQGDNVSSNSTAGNIVIGNGNGNGKIRQWVEEILSMQIVIGTPAGNDNTTLINILSYNIINPQVSLQGGNTSDNSAISNVVVGSGNHSQVTSAGGLGTSVIGAVLGNGNTTLIAFFSGNIFNPQISLFGTNIGSNTAITNVSAVNGNYSATSVTSGGLFGTTLFGGVIGNGNTTQLASIVGNIFNPQISLFGSNTSRNRAATGVAVDNGNSSQTSTTSGGLLSAMLFGGMTGNGNTNQFAGFVSNITNSQFTFRGRNESENDATTNVSADNGNFSENEVGSTGGLGNNVVVAGVNGNGNSQQSATASSNIINDQIRLGNEVLLPGTALPVSEQPDNGAELRTSLVASPGATGLTKSPDSSVVSRIEDAVDAEDPIDRTLEGSPDSPSSGSASPSDTSTGDGSTGSSDTDNTGEGNDSD